MPRGIHKPPLPMDVDFSARPGEPNCRCPHCGRQVIATGNYIEAMRESVNGALDSLTAEISSLSDPAQRALGLLLIKEYTEAEDANDREKFLRKLGDFYGVCKKSSKDAGNEMPDLMTVIFDTKPEEIPDEIDTTYDPDLVAPDGSPPTSAS